MHKSYQRIKWLLAAVAACIPFNVFCRPTLSTKAQEAVSAAKIPPIFEATFTYTSYEPTVPDSITLTGKIWMKGTKYRLELPEQTLISNGKLLWNYWKELQEVHLHAAVTGEIASTFSPVELLRFYQTYFIPVSINQVVMDHQPYEVVEMEPKEEANSVARLTLTIASKEKKLNRIQAYEKQGTVHVVTLLQLIPKKSLPDHYFEFTMPPGKGVELIDLR